MRKLLILLSLISLVGCGAEYAHDPELRAERFDSCMKQVTSVPNAIVYTNVDAMVDSCRAAAQEQARVCVSNCPDFKMNPINVSAKS